MKKLIITLVEGAIGAVALYVVGKVAFRAGHELAEAECRYEQLQNGIQATSEPEQQETAENEKTVAAPLKKSKLGTLFSVRKAFGHKGTSIISDLVQNPENHMIEACVKGREIHVNVKPRTA